MNSAIEILNHWGGAFLDFARAMFWQSSLLVLVLLALDFGLRHRVRAAVRHGLWLVLLVKLVLPTNLALPTSPAWWWSRATAVPVVPAPVNAPNYPVTPNNLPLPDVPMPAWTELPPRPALTPAAGSLVCAVVVSLGLLGWLLCRWRQVVRASRAAVSAAALAPCLSEARELANLWSPVPVRLTEDTLSPAVCGLFRPVILVPRALAATLAPEQLRAVLLHELMHVRRGDVWVNFAQALLQIFYWWHPLVWVANARIRRVREEAVDEAVMVALRGEADSYAPTLLAVAKFALHRPRASLGLLGIMESRSALRQRIERLVTLPVPRRAGLGVVGALGVVAFSAVALPMGEAPPLPAQPDNGLATNATNPPDVNQLLIDAMTLYEAHQWDAARLKLAQVLRTDPANPAALYYWRLVHAPAAAPATATNLFSRTFRVRPEIFLRKMGLSPTTSTRTNSPGSQTNPDELGQPLQFYFHTIGVDLLPPKAVFFNQTRSLLFVRATESDLDNVERVLSIMNNTNAPPAAGAFQLTPGTVTTNLSPWVATNPAPANTTGILSNPNFRAAIKALEQRSGVEKLAGPEVTTTSGRGVNRMRGSVMAENVLGASMLTVPVYPRVQVHIKSYFIEMPGPLGDIPTLTNQVNAQNLTGIMTEAQARQWLHQLPRQPGVETLAEPEVTTVSGRQTQMRATELITVVTGFNTNATGQNDRDPNRTISLLTTNAEVGPVIDVVPYVLADGYTVDLTVIASDLGFAGYDVHTNSAGGFDLNPNPGLPAVHPAFIQHQFIARADIYDSQALLFYETQPRSVSFRRVPDPNHPDSGAARSGQKWHLVVLTFVNIVDPAGNLVHRPEDIPFARDHVPPAVLPQSPGGAPLDDRPFDVPPTRLHPGF